MPGPMPPIKAALPRTSHAGQARLSRHPIDSGE